jgi:epoxyqueuosine reductase
MLSANLIREKATELGFDLIGFAPAGPTPGAALFEHWLAQNMHGEMRYLARAPQRRANPQHVLGNARTVVMVGLSYESLAVSLEFLQDPSRGRIARYAWGLDYHDVMIPPLRALAEFISKENRAYVDTGPVLERAWAEACGLGFIGKNTCLIHRTRGSFLFLGAVLVSAEIGDARLETELQPSPNSPPQSRKSLCGCGNCTRCLTACPTQAFPAPGVLDARRCISYLTIELKGSIPENLRPHMGNWIFGCDICQDVCPYVRRYTTVAQSRLAQTFFPVDWDRAAPKLSAVLALTPAAFNARYKATPLARAKRRGLLRNACVAAANWGGAEILPALRHLQNDEEPLVREHARWALDRMKN